ncbi:hypothetical protein BsWGS_17400 [Bradybaena similaris]
MARTRQLVTPRVAFIALTAVCLLAMGIFCFTDIHATSTRFVLSVYSDLTQLKLTWLFNAENVTGEGETLANLNDTESMSVRFVKSNTALAVITQANNGSNNFTPEVFSNTTKMTFNRSLEVQCKMSPYIQCPPLLDVKPLPNKVFKVVYLRRPFWAPYDVHKMQLCAVNQCAVSDGPVTKETDVVVVYGVKLKDDFQSPQRWPNQTYIVSVWESPVLTKADFLRNGNSPWNARVNLIMSYRVDADVFVPYNNLRFSPKPLQERPNYYEIAKNKTRTAMWFVSQCRRPSRRDVYVKEMQKYIDVDIYGGCGRPCARSDPSCNNYAKYKFYLSFENSLCTDYVTEKFFKLFDPNLFVIPVVRGGTDYDKYFPSFTYINAAHFKTPRDLALHLKDLASDLETYSKYLEYKDLYVQNSLIDQFCTLCSFLHTHKLPVTKTFNLKEWMNDGHCHNPKDL